MCGNRSACNTYTNTSFPQGTVDETKCICSRIVLPFFKSSYLKTCGACKMSLERADKDADRDEMRKIKYELKRAIKKENRREEDESENEDDDE
jgi:hypothetical protein